jgi:uncharacterized protein (TIGR02246 family)
MRASTIVVVGAAIAITACAPAEPAGEGPDSYQADRDAIEQLLRDYDAAITADDGNALAAFFTPGGVEMPPGGPAVEGVEAIRAREVEFLTANDDELTSTIEKIEVSGDLAVVRTSYTETWAPRDGGEARSIEGKSILVLHRQADGSWKVDSVIWNTTRRIM